VARPTRGALRQERGSQTFQQAELDLDSGSFGQQEMIFAKIHDASDAGPGVSSPRFINVSILRDIERTMTVGFVLRAESPRTVGVGA
jgi:hypothetical protein